MGMKACGVRGDLKVVALSNWKNEWKRWQEEQVWWKPSMVQFGYSI